MQLGNEWARFASLGQWDDFCQKLTQPLHQKVLMAKSSQRGKLNHFSILKRVYDSE
jgi:hypothetical protein